MWSGQAAPGAVGERRRPPGDGQGAQEIRVEDEIGVVVGCDEGPQPRDEQHVLGQRGLPLLRCEALSGLEHRGPGCVAGIVDRELRPVGLDRLHLAHRVQGPSLVQLDVDMGEGLEARTDAARGLADPARDTSHAPMLTGEEGDDAIRLTELLGAQHYRLVAVHRHARFLRMEQEDPGNSDLTRAEAASTVPPADPSPMPTTAPSAEDSSATPPVLVAADSRFLRKTLVMVVIAILGLQVIAYTWGALGGFLFNLLLAWLIAISVDPLVSGLTNRGMRRGVATAIVAVSSFVLIAVFIALFGSVLAQQVTELILAVPALALDITAWANSTFDAQIDPTQLTQGLNLTSQQITEIASYLAGGVLGVFTSVVGAVFDFVTIIVFSFYFSADAPRIKRWIASWLKPSRQIVFINVWDISVQKAGGFVISRLALASISAFFHSLFFALIDIPYWLPMGIFAGVVSQFIPTIGTYIGVALPALFAAFDDPLDILWIVLFATVYQQIENYVLTPRISTRTMDINSGVALASVFIGAALFGPIGAIIGIPMAAIIIAVSDAYGRRYDLHPSVTR